MTHRNGVIDLSSEKPERLNMEVSGMKERQHCHLQGCTSLPNVPPLSIVTMSKTNGGCVFESGNDF